MKKFIFILFFIFSINIVSFADEIQIPFSCWPKELQSEFVKTGRKLDLSGEERTLDSWGYIVNEGSQYKIFTYKSTTKEDLETILKIAQEVELSQRENKENGQINGK